MKSHAASFSLESLFTERTSTALNAPNALSRGTGTTPNFTSGPFFLTNGITQLSRMNIEAEPDANPCASCLSAQSSDFFAPCRCST